MELNVLPQRLTVCKLSSPAAIPPELLSGPEPVYLGIAEGETSLVCPTCLVPAEAIVREDGWKALRVCGTLDFSLVGVLARLSALLAEAGVSIFAVSTYDTDCILVREPSLRAATAALRAGGYTVSGLDS